MRFKNREEAGRLLAGKLSEFKNQDPVVFALPRGGVVVGYEVAKHLGVPLDVIITRKIGHPSNPEYAICAVAEDGHTLCDESETVSLDKNWLSSEINKEKEEARRRRELYLGESPQTDIKGKTAIIVDDGIATGLTLRLAIEESKHRDPQKIIVAVPVAPEDAARQISKKVDEFIALDIPAFYMGAVGAYYDEFGQVEDKEVIRLLNKG